MALFSFVQKNEMSLVCGFKNLEQANTQRNKFTYTVSEKWAVMEERINTTL